MSQNITYRPDIDGLRAIAVMAVVFYHAGWWPFSGGYVGVDVFFVISGYLITKIIYKEVVVGDFSFAKFYERRIRRIVPALFLVLFVTSILSYYILSPLQYGEFSENLIATIFFSSNISLWVHTGGYFDNSDLLKPLLHTWSLAIEEQFYLFFPIILIALHLIEKKLNIKVNIVVSVGIYGVVAVSFLLAVASILSGVAVNASFFLLPFRAWELGIGALLALGSVPTIQHRFLREIVSIIGLLIISIAIFSYDHETPFPGYAALLPCVGVGIIIYYGHGTIVGRFLSLKPMVFVGLISYSLYLWHWPLLSLMRIWNMEVARLNSLRLDTLRLDQSITIVVLSFVLAILSWRYVEQPFRRQARWLSYKQLLSLTAFASSVFLCMGIWGIVEENQTVSQLPPYVKKYITSHSEKVEKRIQGMVDKISGKGDSVNKDVRSENKPTHAPYVVLGDSHASAMRDIFYDTAKKYGSTVDVLSFGGCPPIIGLYHEACETHVGVDDVIYNIANDPSVNTVIISAYYAFYIYGPLPGFRKFEKVTDSSGIIYPVGDERQKIFLTKLTDTIKLLKDKGKNVVLIYPVPDVGYDVMHAYIRLRDKGVNDASYPMDYFWKRNGWIVSTFDKLSNDLNLYNIKPHESMCNDGYCKIIDNGYPLYYDYNHVIADKADYLRPQIEELFKKIEGK